MKPVYHCERHGYSNAPNYGGWGIQGPRCLHCERSDQRDIRLRAEAMEKRA